MVTVAICTLLAVDVDRGLGDPPQVGEIARQTVRAPYAFSWVDDTTLNARRAEAASQVLPVFLYDEGWLKGATARLVAAFRAARDVEGGTAVLLRDAGLVVPAAAVAPLANAGFPDDAAARIGAWLGEAYGDRLVPADRTDLPEQGPLRVVPRVGDRDAFVLSDRERVVTAEEVRRAVEVAALRNPGPAEWSEAALALAVAMVQPNLVHDPDRTAAARQAASDGVSGDPVQVQRGEILFREGDRIGTADVARHEAMQERRSERGLLSAWAVVGGWLLVALGGLVVASKPYLRHAPDDDRNLAAGGVLLVGVALAARLVTWVAEPFAALMGDVPPEAFWYGVPVAGGAMMARLLMGTSRAVVFTLAASIVLVPLMRLDALVLVHATLTSLVGASAVAQLRERIAVLRAGLLSGVFGAGLVAWAFLVHAWATTGLGGAPVPWVAPVAAMLGGVLSGIVVLAFLPLFELMGFVTDYRMLELASLNHPVMRQLMLRAPGTHHHSVVVGTLAEAACEAIGANALQAKVAAYFHDIGKAVKPGYFIENQRGGANRHNDLDPVASARVIIDHVHQGARMAREHGLPKPILDNILMHHGTGLLQYFYAKAVQEAADPSLVSEEAFRYPGPKPNTREAGVVMLADKVEAATRTLHDPSEANLRAMINRIINSVMSDDQFSDCPLTFREIYVIADEFTRVLRGIYHQRIEYPQTASVSRATSRPPRGELPAPGVVTLELEGAGLRTLAPAEAEEDDVSDEVTDYESVRNLPHGEP